MNSRATSLTLAFVIGMVLGSILLALITGTSATTHSATAIDPHLVSALWRLLSNLLLAGVAAALFTLLFSRIVLLILFSRD
ncbi:MAG: hypothetical protein KDI44_02650 [Thiothrix sp.]|nr:hypothetical protein [Thiothrix sp.]HPQ95740.1 hypothetical protein [Thiolinea sp.]